MPGLDPGIHVFPSTARKRVDARTKCGHDGLKQFARRIAALLTLTLVAACTPPESPPGLKVSPSSYSMLPGWGEDGFEGVLSALLNSCKAIAKQKDDAPIGPKALGGVAGDWQAPCAAAKELASSKDPLLVKGFFERWFVPFLAEDVRGKPGLFTGYYEAEIEAARAPDSLHMYPLYRMPKEPTKLTRAEIEAGALRGQGLEFLWLKDPVDAFFLQIQGSGIVKLNDGKEMRVGYAGNNGQAFVAIGKLMIEEGIIDRSSASMQTIRAWLRANPDKAQAMMNRNPRFIFFREVKENGPVGAMGVTLTAGRSLAVDPAFVPLGLPLWLDTTWPVDHGSIKKGQPLRRLMLAQDVGTAIKGPVRGDFFWGSGEEALNFAGSMKNAGKWFMLLPVTAAARKTLDVVDIVSSLK
ncbi:murein transglycosylase A [Dongia sp.]|uniref:murein transglycosylase A n=1 Tax=Dongia sp. TaxID=1977262 RepID=UPI0035B3A0DF